MYYVFIKFLYLFMSVLGKIHINTIIILLHGYSLPPFSFKRLLKLFTLNCCFLKPAFPLKAIRADILCVYPTKMTFTYTDKVFVVPICRVMVLGENGRIDSKVAHLVCTDRETPCAKINKEFTTPDVSF